VSTDTPRPALDSSLIAEKISRYWRVSVVEVTGSTQDDLARLISQSKASTGEVITTNYQSAGRGRLDRKFNAPASSALMFSFYLEPRRDKSDWSFLPLLTGLAVIFTMSSLDPEVNTSLKWPNDLLIENGKVGGIIAQATASGIIIGVGINVAMSELELPVSHATSLQIKGFKELNRNAILSTFLNQVEDLIIRWENGEDLRHLYLQHCITIGSPIRAELPGLADKSGVAVGITPSGELILEDGARITVGDIVHLR
jgi:BirA family biotin operon repressor/biotin-[acetyl-CoA-carboxylase] ligase